MEDDSGRIEVREESNEELGWFGRVIERLFGNENWKHLSHDCSYYPYCHFWG